MNQEILLIHLRSRLAIVSRDITRLLDAKRPDQQQFLINAGKTDALMVEQQFLADLIGRIEREGVQP